MSETDISGDTSGTYGGSSGDDTVGDTSGSYSVDDQGNVTDNFSLGISPSLSQEAMDSIGRGLSQEEKGFFGQGYNVQDFGRQSVSNVSNARNYDPNFAMLDKISRGLAGQVPGLKDFDKTTFGMNISTNPLAQIDPSSRLGQKYSQALALAPTMMGPFSKTGLQGLTLSQIDKMDPMGLASLMAAANMSRNNPYGTTSAPGYVGTVAEMLGLVQSPQDISYNMSLKDAVQTARSGLAYGTVPGQNVSNFGQISGITDQFSKDMSNISMDKIGRDFSTAGKGIANLAANAFNEVTTAVKDAIEFATNPYGGINNKDVTGQFGVPDNRSFDAFGNVVSSPAASSLIDNYDQINAGILGLDQRSAKEANTQVADSSSLFSPQSISQGLNYFAGPQIQDFFRGVTNNPNVTTKIGPGYDIDKQKMDDNLFSINIPFSTG